MRAIDAYKFYKSTYKEYVILIMSGVFYEIFNDDVSVIYSLFSYKVKCNGYDYNSGFPLSNLNKVISELEKKKINYIVVDMIDDKYDIVDRKKFSKNNYNNYQISPTKLVYLIERIEKINEKLKHGIGTPNINQILDEMDKLI